ncbi:MAG: hypothetical protein K8Q91_01420 [Candidatus Vogelbacteria bacterium]|nr:hypothetical protein [Candidatus Vogelbacteria bacterium]
MIWFWEMELRRIQKELVIINANIESKWGNPRRNVENKIRLQTAERSMKKKLDKLKGGADVANQESAA